jgi:hypothetical protein
LEQLRVVSRGQINVNDVIDANTSASDELKYIAGMPTDLSFVSVRFT